MRNNSNIKICPVCKKEFECYSKTKANHPHEKSKRRSNAITCSKKCSRRYIYVKYYEKKRIKNV